MGKENIDLNKIDSNIEEKTVITTTSKTQNIEVTIPCETIILDQE
jgi:hypothetical protein